MVMVMAGLAAVLLGGTSASAQEDPAPDRTVSIPMSPGSVAPGTPVTIQGTGCPPDAAWGSGQWAVSGRVLQAGQAPTTEHNVVQPADDPAPGPVPSSNEDYPGRVDIFATATSDGSWQTTFVVPANAPAGDYPVAMVCYGDEGVAGKVGYATPVLTVQQQAEAPAPAERVVSISMSPASVAPGGSVTVQGTGCPPDAAWGQGTWALTGVSLPAGTAPTSEHNIVHPEDDPAPGPAPTASIGYPGRVDLHAVAEPDGTWTATFVVPAGTPPGDYPIALVCFGGEGVAGNVGYATPVLTVQQQAAAPVPERPRQAELPRTGTRDLLPLALVGAALVSVGLLCRVPSRRH